MAIYASATGGGDFKQVPPGLHPAICCRLIDLGTQYSEFYKKSSRKILVSWELHGEDEEGKPLTVVTEKHGEQPLTISRRFTLSLGEKASLTAFITGWRGKGFTEEELTKFDLAKLLNARCYLNIVQEKDGDKTYSNAASAAPLPKGIRDSLPKVALNPIVEFSLEEPNWETFNKLSENLKATIMKSSEYLEKYNGSSGPATSDTGDTADPEDHDPFADND